MDLARVIIRVENRNMIFFGTVHQGMMTATHMIDQSRCKMYSFRHEKFMGKRAEEPFECSDRRKILAGARRKYGIGASLCFEHYRCELSTKADADGDHTITLVDVRDGSDILQPFAEKHWDIML